MSNYFIIAFHSFALPEPPIALINDLNYAKSPFPLTRGYLKSTELVTQIDRDNIKKEHSEVKTVTKILKRKYRKRGRKPKCKVEAVLPKKRGRKPIHADKDNRFSCSICKKLYKYRRNKLRHEKYECVTGPQFGCEKCGKKYSQKKTLISHIAQKHPKWLEDYKEDCKKPLSC